MTSWCSKALYVRFEAGTWAVSKTTAFRERSEGIRIAVLPAGYPMLTRIDSVVSPLLCAGSAMSTLHETQTEPL